MRKTMLIKFLKFSSVIAFTVLIIQCQGSLDPSKREALQLYNQLSEQAEKAIDDHAHLVNDTKVMDNHITNSDTLNVHRISDALEGVESVEQLLIQWRRDLPVVPGAKNATKETESTLSGDELMAKLNESKEKLNYIEFRINDIKELLKQIDESKKPREQ